MWLCRALHTRCGKAAGRAGRHQHFSGFHVPGQFGVHQQLHDVAQSSRSKASCQDVRVFVNGEENDLCLAVLLRKLPGNLDVIHFWHGGRGRGHSE